MPRHGCFVAALVLAGLLCQDAFAAKGDQAQKKAKSKQDPSAIFKKLDANSDGKVSQEEFAKITELRKKARPGKPGKTDKLFSKLDGNSDGSLSLDELKKIGEVKKKKNKNNA